MLRIVGRTWGVTLVIGLLGVLLGFGIDLALRTEGWAVVVGSMGLCAGAALGGTLATPEPPPLAPAEATLLAEAPATTPTTRTE
jgi:hypothetical protein